MRLVEYLIDVFNCIELNLREALLCCLYICHTTNLMMFYKAVNKTMAFLNHDVLSLTEVVIEPINQKVQISVCVCV
jgi:hypothetical protein